jgi:hypothetical protein
MAILAVPAFGASTCLQDEYNNVAKQKLNCTANDVRVAEAVNIRDLGGSNFSTCFEGSTFDFIADFKIVTSSTSTRSNIGLYFANQGTTSALATGGSCVDNIIQPGNPPCPGTVTLANPAGIPCGSDVHDEFDAQPDNCGDSSSQDNGAFGAGSQKVTVEVTGFKCDSTNSVPCPNDATKRCLSLPNCTSWQIPGGTIQCQSPSPNFTWVQAAIPGTPSKCNCGVITLPITPVTVTPTIQKACTTASTPGTPGPAVFTQGANPTQTPTTCVSGAEGSTITYHVAITNTSTVTNNNVAVDQVCDTVYGTIYDDDLMNTANPPARVFAACAAGVPSSLNGTATNVNCGTQGTIAPGATQICTFTAPQGELANVTDTVNASGHSTLNTSSTFNGTQVSSNSVTVTSTDAPSTATVTKGIDSTTAGCATVRYTVGVHNSSGADENLSLTAFNDSQYGSITTVHAPDVLGTTCGVATGVAGLGTLSGSTGGGSLPATLAVSGSDYTCKFDGQFCGALSTITKPDGNTCLGLQHVNKVTGTIHGDEGVNDVVTQTGNTLTVDECFTTFTSSSTP